MKRKPPVRHKVSGYTRGGKRVRSYTRGSGVAKSKKSKAVTKKKREGYRIIQLDDSANLGKAGYSWVLEEGIIHDPHEVRNMWVDYGHEKYTPTGKTKKVTFMLIVHNRLYPTEVTARQGYRFKPGDDEWYIDDIPG